MNFPAVSQWIFLNSRSDRMASTFNFLIVVHKNPRNPHLFEFVIVHFLFCQDVTWCRTIFVWKYQFFSIKRHCHFLTAIVFIEYYGLFMSWVGSKTLTNISSEQEKIDCVINERNLFRIVKKMGEFFTSEQNLDACLALEIFTSAYSKHRPHNAFNILQIIWNTGNLRKFSRLKFKSRFPDSVFFRFVLLYFFCCSTELC